MILLISRASSFSCKLRKSYGLPSPTHSWLFLWFTLHSGQSCSLSPSFKCMKLGIYSHLLIKKKIVWKQWVADWGVPKRVLCTAPGCCGQGEAGPPFSPQGLWGLKAPVHRVTSFFIAAAFEFPLCAEKEGTEGQAWGQFPWSHLAAPRRYRNNLCSTHESGEP